MEFHNKEGIVSSLNVFNRSKSDKPESFAYSSLGGWTRNKDKNEGIAHSWCLTLSVKALNTTEFLTKIYNLRKKGSKRQALSTILMVTSAWIIKISITITKNTTTPFSTEWSDCNKYKCFYFCLKMKGYNTFPLPTIPKITPNIHKYSMTF